MPSLPTPSPASPPTHARDRLSRVLESAPVQRVILALIVLNAILLGLQTSKAVMAAFGPLIDMADRAIVLIFVIELALRLYVRRLQFFRDPWSVFDLLVVATALIPANTHFSVLRALRILRVLRVVTIAPSMRRVVGSLLAAIPGLGSIITVLLLIFYVFAVIATHLFSERFPDWFGHVGRSLYTLFQVMTLESWSMGISRPVMAEFPYAWAFFVPFILVATFTMLNLFIAVIVAATQSYAESQEAQAREAAIAAGEAQAPDLHDEVRALRVELAEVRRLLAERRRAPEN
jgi:voltage-gated sodium channel